MTWEIKFFSLIVCYLWDQIHFGRKIIQQEQVQFSVEAVYHIYSGMGLNSFWKKSLVYRGNRGVSSFHEQCTYYCIFYCYSLKFCNCCDAENVCIYIYMYVLCPFCYEYFELWDEYHIQFKYKKIVIWN